MISYNPKDWVTFIFRFHKSDTLRKLFPLIIFISLYSAGIAWLEINYWKLPDDHPVRNITIMHSLLGFVISLLLVFRTNTAYDRWWEGRKQWGALLNSSRNLAIKLSTMLRIEDDENRKFFHDVIPKYAFALQKHLCEESTRLELDEKLHPEFEGVNYKKHLPNQLACALYTRANKLFESGKISGEQLIVLNRDLENFTNICGACERIKNTPIPYSYSAFIRKFIFFFVLTLPFGYAFLLGGYLVIPVVAFVFYVLASLELVAEEIEDPFGKDVNDLPLLRISENIERSVHELI
ncbi:MAG: bestrophin family ion channel [Chitinophagaceae bacterium]